MSAKELDRTEVFIQLQQKVVSQREAAELLGITTRHVRRLFQEYKKIGGGKEKISTLYNIDFKGDISILC